MNKSNFKFKNIDAGKKKIRELLNKYDKKFKRLPEKKKKRKIENILKNRFGEK